ncbi:MAG: nitroreductase family protein [Prevotella sp.]|nr:nitroreductase family protein [Prevotella sp.]
MRNLFIVAFIMTAHLSCMAQSKVELPAPVGSGGMGLFEVLQKRASIRDYSDKDISDKTLSQVLWAACGKNRPDGRITAPSAVNAQDVVVYVCKANGAFLYDAQNNTLVQVSKKDLRKAVAGRQEFAAKAPVSLVLVSNLEKLPRANQMLGAMDVGYVSENICLACTALGLATVPRATMDIETLKKELGLGEKQVPMLNNPVGYPIE